MAHTEHRAALAAKRNLCTEPLSAFALEVLAGQQRRVPDHRRPFTALVGPVKPSTAQAAPRYSITCSLCSSPSTGQVCAGCSAFFAAGGAL